MSTVADNHKLTEEVIRDLVADRDKYKTECRNRADLMADLGRMVVTLNAMLLQIPGINNLKIKEITTQPPVIYPYRTTGCSDTKEYMRNFLINTRPVLSMLIKSNILSEQASTSLADKVQRIRLTSEEDDESTIDTQISEADISEFLASEGLLKLTSNEDTLS